MLLLLVIAFISGLVTILAPCIWPLLPIVLSSSLSGSKSKSLGITIGIVTSFAFFTLTLSYLVTLLRLDPNVLRLFAVIIIGFLGVTLLVPQISSRLEATVSKLSGRFGSFTNTKSSGFYSGLITGLALGIVWTPCAGPILATIATLAATQAVNFQIVLVTLVYSLGIAIPLFLFSYTGNLLFTKSRLINKYTGKIQQIFGIILLLMALAIYTNYDKIIQAKLLDLIPSYSTFINKIETTSGVIQQLDNLKGNNRTNITQTQNSQLGTLGPAPEFTGIEHWLNSNPLTMASLKGKVVLVDFWTYTCINCIRTLPYVTSWYEKYKDQGFIVIGVHTPEFEFEKNTQNVQNAAKLYKINYPIAQDNDYKTWDAFSNHYWPAKYLIDKNGVIRYQHFGEGEYDKTEMAIKDLLAETGATTDNNLVDIPSQTPAKALTPETYLGTARIERLAPSQSPQNTTQTFSLVQNLPPDYFAFGGTWTLSREYAQTQKDSTLELNFYASKVYLVITPKTQSDTVKVFIDGNLTDQTTGGTDVKNGLLKATEPRLYNLIDLKGNTGSHILRLEFQSEGTQVFAFTFG